MKRTAIWRYGKQARRWKQFRDEEVVPYFREKYGDNLYCGICGKWVSWDEVIWDHIKGRGSHPELRYVLSNTQPSHWICNYKKGQGIL